MSDKEFLELKNQIKELGSMSRDFNRDCSALNNELSEIKKSITNIEQEMRALKSYFKFLDEV